MIMDEWCMLERKREKKKERKERKQKKESKQFDIRKNNILNSNFENWREEIIKFSKWYHNWIKDNRDRSLIFNLTS